MYYIRKWRLSRLSSSTRCGPTGWALVSTSCSGALHARPSTILLTISEGKSAAFRAHLEPRCRLAFLRCCMQLHCFAAGHHACALHSSIANARSNGVMHGCNPWPRPMHSPASLFDCTLLCAERMPQTTSRRCSAGNGARRAGLDGVGKV